MQPQLAYQKIIQRLREVRDKENRTATLFGFFFSVLLSAGIAILFSLIENIFHFGTTARAVVFYFSLGSFAGLFLWCVGRPLLKLFGVGKRDSEEEIALNVGNYFPHVKDTLRNAMELLREREKTAKMYSTALIDAALLDIYETIAPLDFTLTVDTTRLKKIQKKFSVVAVIVAANAILFPTFFLSPLYRILNYTQNFEAPHSVIFHILPGNKEIVKGESVPVTIRVEQNGISSLKNVAKKSLTLFRRQQGQVNFESLQLRANVAGEFVTEFSLIKNSLWYYAQFEEAKSDEFSISVLDRPLLLNFQLQLMPPRYTKLPAQTLENNVGDVATYKGTQIAIAISSSKKIVRAHLVFSDSTKLPFTISDNNATLNFSLTQERSYHVEILDNDSLCNADPIEYQLKIIPDEFPRIAILAPGKNMDSDQTMELPLQMRMRDDFGLTRLRLAYKLVHSKYSPPATDFSFEEISFPPGFGLNGEMWYRWNFSDLSLVPEDVVQYYTEVFDNDNISGPKSGKSETYLLRLPSLEEVFADVEKNQNQTIESLSNAFQEAQQLNKEMQKLQQELKKRPDKLDWMQKKKAEELAKKYEEVKQKTQQASQQLDQMMHQMQQQQLLSQETMQKYEELQKLMKELDSPEFREALKKLQPEQQPVTPEQMKEALKNFQMNEEQFRKALERMMELMKRIAMEQKLDELLKRTEELIKKQKEVQEQTKNTAAKKQAESLSKKQDEVEKQTDKLEQESKELTEKMKELADEMPVDKMQQANENLEKSNPQQSMQKSKQQMQSGQMSQAKQSQQQAQQSLEQFKQDLQNAQKEMRENQMQQIAKELQKQLENALELSQQQEGLRNATQQLDPNSQRFRDNAEEQNQMRDNVNDVANALSQLGKKSFAISPEMGKALGDAMKQMESALNGMEGRNPGMSAQQQSAAMGSLNKAAAMMQQSLQGMQGGSGGGMGMQGMMQALGQMASQQQGINQGTQGAMGQGGGMTQEQAAAMSRLAQQQGALGKSMSELSGEARASEEMSKLLGDLDNIAKEMQEVVKDMEQGNVNENTIRKQERILSRLLDSQRSMRERDYEKRRKAEQSKTA